MGICIPDYFKLYNELNRNPEDDWKIKPIYAALSAEYGKTSECIACGTCAEHCPQHIAIPDFIAKVSELLEYS